MQDHKKMTAMDYVIFVILSVGALAILIPFWNVIMISFSTQKNTLITL